MLLNPVQINEWERWELLQWRKYGGSLLLRDKAHAALLNAQGYSAHKISQLLFRTEKTIRGWLFRFARYRLSSIFDRYVGNANAGKLTLAQKQEIAGVLAQPPSDYGIPQQFWQVKDLKKWIRAEFGVVYESDRSYHFLFKLGRFSWKLPDKFDVKRDEQAVTARLAEIRQEIVPFLADDNWVVLAGDETRLMWESESRRAWLKTNRKTILKVHRSQDYRSFLGCLSLKAGNCHLYSLSWQNQEAVIAALKKLKKQYPSRKICLIWDNAPWHKGKLIRQKLKRRHWLSNFHLISLPPYAPDTNPQEHVWKYAKDKIAHRQTISFKQKINNFKLAVIHRRFDYQV